MEDEDGLTEKQREVFTYLCEYTQENGYQPDVREICAHFGWRSTNSSSDHLKALARKKLIRLTGRARAIEFIGGPPWMVKSESTA